MGRESVTWKQLPLPGSLSTVIPPPIRSTMFFVMAMPRPVPCTLLVVELSARVKGSKIWVRNSWVMP